MTLREWLKPDLKYPKRPLKEHLAIAAQAGIGYLVAKAIYNYLSFGYVFYPDPSPPPPVIVPAEKVKIIEGRDPLPGEFD